MSSPISAATADQQPPPHLSFRSYVQALKDDGDIVEINTECDPHLEVGAITREALEDNKRAPLFNKLKGQDANGLWRILGAVNGLRADPKQRFGRIARHVGLEPTASAKQIMAKMVAAKSAPPIPPKVV